MIPDTNALIVNTKPDTLIISAVKTCVLTDLEKLIMKYEKFIYYLTKYKKLHDKEIKKMIKKLEKLNEYMKNNDINL